MEETQVRHNWGTEQYFEEINHIASRGVRDIMYLGELFKEAKEKHYTERGVKEGWPETCLLSTGFKRSAVNDLIKIHKNLTDVSAEFEHCLPLSWGTLAYLASLPSDEARLLLHEGIVTRDMQRAEMIFAVKQCKALSKEFRLQFGDAYFHELQDHIMERGLADSAIEGEGKELFRESEDAKSDKVADLPKEHDVSQDDLDEHENSAFDLQWRALIRDMGTSILSHDEGFKKNPKTRSNVLGFLMHHKKHLGIAEITLDPDFE
jgi:hypothetical protein